MKSAVKSPSPVPSAGHLKPSRPGRALTTIGAAVAVALMLGLGGSVNSAFLTPDNGLAILRAAALTGIVAMGATFITLSGRFFSLALGQTAVFAGVTLAVLMAHGTPFVVALAITVAVAAVIGVLQGVLVTMGANPIITTLGAGALLAGLAGLTTGGKNIKIDSSAVEWLGNGRPLGLPTQTWAFFIVAVLAWWAVKYTRFGRETILTGANRATAGGAGIGVAKVTITVFVIASLAAALVGVFGAAQFSQARTSEFAALDFDVIAAVLIGGTAIQGGRGSALMSALGAVLIATVQNYMLLLGWSSGLRTLVTGGFIVAVVVGFHLVTRSKGA